MRFRVSIIGKSGALAVFLSLHLILIGKRDPGNVFDFANDCQTFNRNATSVELSCPPKSAFRK